jgi:hypothetical protein
MKPGAGVEVYREPVTQAPVWPQCAAQWGQGPGFKGRVAARLEGWFAGKNDLKDKLEELVKSLWEANGHPATAAPGAGGGAGG